MKMKISARNQIKGIVEKVDTGLITATVKIKLASSEIITSTITKEAVEELNIKVGDEVIAVIKSTEVMIAKE